MVIMKNNFIFFLIFIMFLIAGCKKDDFKQSCFESRAILEHATSLLIPRVSKSSDLENTVIINDNSKAVVYLEEKYEELKQYYNKIKGQIVDSNNFHDAIYAASYINEIYCFLTGNTLDDRCYYINLLEQNKDVQLSSWLINDFFAPLKNDSSLRKNWIDMDISKKRAIILRMLFEAKENCKEIHGNQNHQNQGP